MTASSPRRPFSGSTARSSVPASASGLRFADPRIHALWHALILFRLLPKGLPRADLRNYLAELSGHHPETLGQGAMTYQLRRLRLHGMIQRLPHTQCYHVTHAGFRAAWSDVLGLVRWPILAGIVTLALAIVYRYAPDRAEPKWQWISWGSVAATALWILGSIAFTTYVSKVGSYDKTYGSLGGVIILLLWFYLTAYVILAGAELNAEIERQTTRAKQDSLRRARSIRNGSDSGRAEARRR